jgi:hypothetical protein
LTYLYLEDGDDMFLQNSGIYLQDYMALLKFEEYIKNAVLYNTTAAAVVIVKTP